MFTNLLAFLADNWFRILLHLALGALIYAELRSIPRRRILRILARNRRWFKRLLQAVGLRHTPPPPVIGRGSRRKRKGPPPPLPVKTYPQLYKFGVFMIALVWVLMGWLLLGKEVTISEHTYNVGLQIWLLGFLHLAAGVRIVDRSYVAGVLFLGIPTVEISGGILVAPWLFCKFVEYPLAPVEIEVPNPTKVVDVADDEQRPPGTEEPIRIVFAGRTWNSLDPKLRKNIKKDSILLNQATQRVSFVVRFTIRRASRPDEYGFYDFYVRVGSFANARVQIKPVGVAKLGEEFNSKCVAEVLEKIHDHNTQLLIHMQMSFESWGVEIHTAKVQVHTSKTINVAILKVPLAQASAQETVFAAGAEKTRLTREGEGRGAAEQAVLQGRGQGLKDLMTSTGIKDPSIAVAAQVADEVAKGPNNKTFILPNFDLAAFARSFASGASNQPPNPPAGGARRTRGRNP